jgi:hypothetical protein
VRRDYLLISVQENRSASNSDPTPVPQRGLHGLMMRYGVVNDSSATLALFETLKKGLNALSQMGSNTEVNEIKSTSFVAAVSRYAS